jgi:hypothetical protein
MGMVMSPPAYCYLDYFGAIFPAKLKQQSNGRPTCKEGVLPELPCPRQLEPCNHTREPSSRVLHVPLLFGKHSLICMVSVCRCI